MVSALASSSLAEDRKKEDSEKLNAFVRDCDLLEDKNQREHEEGVPGEAARAVTGRCTTRTPHSLPGENRVARDGRGSCTRH